MRPGCLPVHGRAPWGIYAPTAEEAAVFEKVDVPVMFTTSEFDLPGAVDQQENILGEGYRECIERFVSFNEVERIDFDFKSYPVVGFRADRIVNRILNDEYENTTWYLNNKEGIPMVAVLYKIAPHGLYPEYGMLAWSFAKRYSGILMTEK